MTIIDLNEHERPYAYEVDDELPPPDGISTVDGEYLVTREFVMKFAKFFESRAAVLADCQSCPYCGKTVQHNISECILNAKIIGE